MTPRLHPVFEGGAFAGACDVAEPGVPTLCVSGAVVRLARNIVSRGLALDGWAMMPKT